jgi:phage terminase small subunit
VNARQQRFVAEYLIDLNATEAAKRAGYSARTSYAIGQRLLKNVEISAAIATAEVERASRVQVKADEVLRELVAIVRTNPSRFTTDAEGRLVLADPDDTESWRAVASVKQKTRYIPRKDDEDIVEREVEFKLWDKNSAIDKAMRHLGILATEVNVHMSAVEQFMLRRHAARQNGANGHRAGA